MHTFEVWAPLVKTIAVRVNGARFCMQGPDDRGWWRARVNEAGPGSDYGFLIDEEELPYPDPRSQWQPHGVHGLSRVYDQSAFSWNDAGFRAVPLASAIVYEMHIGTFTMEGTFDSAIEKLDALKNLGVTHLELMPVASFAGRHGWGYDGVALYSVHQPYGGPDALKRFVNAAHGKGLAVLLDVVYNHFGPSGNYTGKFGPYITELHHTPWGGAVNLEAESADEVRRFFCDNALMWMRDYHFDGLRLDAVHAYIDRSAIPFLEQLTIETKALEARLARPLVLVAESDLNDPRIVTSRDAGGFGIDAQWSDDFHHALFAALADEPLGGYYTDFGAIEQLAKAIEKTFVYDGIYSKHRRRVHGRPAAHLPQNRFFGFIQNHDQVGNRAVGERVHETIGFDRAKIAAALVLTSPFVPMLFQGEEWAASSPFQYFADHEDPTLARLVSIGRKKEFEPFGWNPDLIPDPENPETYKRSRLNWNEVNEGQHAEMLTWYRDLIALRKASPEFNEGDAGRVRVECDSQERKLVVARGGVRVLCNLGMETRRFSLPEPGQILLSSQEVTQAEGQTIEVPPNTVAIVKTSERSA